MKRVLLYSSVASLDLFYLQKFYVNDIELLKRLGFKVELTNRIFDFFKWYNYDISFIYFYKLGLFPAFMSKLFAKKVFFTGGIDGIDSSINTGFVLFIRRLLFYLCSLLANKCFIVSDSDWDNIHTIYKKYAPSNLVLSYHSIELDKFICHSKTKEKIFSTICWMENIDNLHRKGVDKSLYIFSELIKTERFKDYKYYIIGRCGLGAKWLQDYAAELHISDSIYFLGELSEADKIDWLNKSSYYFQLSVYEGFGVAALEALAAGNIVIHSGNGGLMSSIGFNGVVFNSNDVNVLIAELNLFESNYDLNKIESFLYEKFSMESRMKDFSIMK